MASNHVRLLLLVPGIRLLNSQLLLSPMLLLLLFPVALWSCSTMF
jgi:hypothetical protein